MNIQLRILREKDHNEHSGYRDTLQQRTKTEHIDNPIAGRTIVGWTDWEAIKIVLNN